MRDFLSLRCANCGTALEQADDGGSGVTCSVCQLFNPATAFPAEPDLTLETLETRLSDLVAQARASDIPLVAITHVLRDELEFTAELASNGRALSVQIIDLGPQVSRQPHRRSSRDENVMLRGRAVGG